MIFMIRQIRYCGWLFVSLALFITLYTFEANASPRQGGVFQLAYWAAGRGLDVCRDSDGISTQAWVPVYEGLVSFDYRPGEDYRKELRIVPYLAERWEQPDETTYIFHLRKGVKWHDGRSFTADDVVFSLNYIRDPNNRCLKRSNLDGVKNIESLNATTVRITTEGPMALLLENLAKRETVIFPKHLHDTGRLFKGVAGTVGTGPMRLKLYDRNQYFVYEAFENYWKGRPHLDGMVAYIMPEPQSRLAAFIGGRLDVLRVADKAQADAAIARVPGAVVEEFSSSHGYAIYPRVDRPPFSDIRVRQAIHLALNRQEMVKVLAFGAGTVNPPGVAGVSEWSIPKEQLLKLPGYRLPKDDDLKQAKQLLKEAGYGDGLTFSIQAVSVWQNPRIAEVVAAQLKQIGITVKLEFIEAAQYFANQRKGNFEAQLNGMSSDFLDASLYEYYYSRAGGNAARVADPELDHLIELQRRTLDRRSRYEVLRKIQHYLLEKMYVIPTIDLAMYWIRRPYLHDLVNSRSTPAHLYRAADIWLGEGVPNRTLP